MATVAARKIGGKRRRHDLTLKERYDVIKKKAKFNNCVFK